MILLLQGSRREVAQAGLPGDYLLVRGDAPLGSGTGRGAVSGVGRVRRVMSAQKGPSGSSYLLPLTPTD